MPVTVFDIKGVPGHRHERIEAAVVAGGNQRRDIFNSGGQATEGERALAIRS
jgi:hypothetical protein